LLVELKRERASGGGEKESDFALGVVVEGGKKTFSLSLPTP
jgi:hypothetical protein